MSSVSGRPIFVGCATDRKFVGPTAAMLSSLDDNGDVPEATVLVADFGLTEEDRAVLRDSAGRLGPAMRFVAIDRGSPKIVAMPSFSLPLPLFGRLVLPGEIDAPGARLLLIDSDIVVNHSLRPLFAIDLMGRPVAAAQDPLMEIEYHHHRKSGPVYFNAGFMLLDLDLFNSRKLGEAAMRQLAAYDPAPIYFDQCAMNEVLKGDWLELDRAWNFFQTGYGRSFDRADYEAAHIIHFAGYKPWDVDWHPATPIWNHHATRAQEKATAWRERVNARPVDRGFVAIQYEVLLGREMESEAVAESRAALSRTQATAAIVESVEFRDVVLAPLAAGRTLGGGLRDGTPTLAQRLWAADELPVLPATTRTIREAASWRDLLGALVRDGRFMGTAGLEPAMVASEVDASTALAESAHASSPPGARSLLNRFLQRSLEA